MNIRALATSRGNLYTREYFRNEAQASDFPAITGENHIPNDRNMLAVSLGRTHQLLLTAQHFHAALAASRLHGDTPTNLGRTRQRAFGPHP